MSIEEYRSNRNTKLKKKLKLKDSIRKFVNRVLMATIVVLLGLIITNKNASLKELVNKYIYTDNIKFTEMKKIYNKYFGKYLGEDNTDKKVFSEKISYLDSSKYKDGVKLTVDNNYLVPSIDAGIVIFIGEKEGFGTTVIVEQIDGVDVWYSNINPKDIKLYDYIEKGNLIGEAKDKNIYLLFQKDGKSISYKKYI